MKSNIREARKLASFRASRAYGGHYDTDFVRSPPDATPLARARETQHHAQYQAHQIGVRGGGTLLRGTHFRLRRMAARACAAGGTRHTEHVNSTNGRDHSDPFAAHQYVRAIVARRPDEFRAVQSD